jgi:cell division protein FtsL
MAAVAERERAVRARPPRTPTRERPARGERRRPRVAHGVVWIAAIAVLLAGVVAMNVAVLRLNLRLDDLASQRARLRADNAQLASQLSSAAASAQIQNLAQAKLGMVPAEADQTRYITLAGR